MRIKVIGIGNILLRDEGFGVHVIRCLESRSSLPTEVELVDCGTAGMYMAPVLEECDRLIVVDILALDQPPGTVCTLSGEDLKAGNIQLRMSPHQLGFLEIMGLCELRGNSPELLTFIGVVPAELDVGVELSELLVPKVEVIADMVENQVKEWINA